MMRSSPLPSRHTCCATLTALLILLGGASPLMAQDKAAAAAYFEEGQAAYAGGDYGEAILKFAQAYQEDPNGIFLYMSSLAYLKSDNTEKALEFARRANEQSGDLDEDMRARNMARIQAIESARERRSTGQSVGVAMEPLLRQKNGSPPRRGLGAVGWTGLGVTVVGTGMMLGSLYFDNKVKGYRDERGRTPQEFADEANQARFAGLTLLASGAILTLVGGGLFVYALGSREKGSDVTLQLTPLKEGGYAGFRLSF